MRRLAVLLAVLALACAPIAWAALGYSSGATGLAISQTNRTITFTDNHSGGGSTAFAARHVLIRSRSTSANTCHVDFSDGTATTADTRLAPGDSISRTWDERDGGAGGWFTIGAICATGETATWDVDAWR